MKNSNDNIWNQTHDLQVCSTVPQPTAFLCSHRRIAVTLILSAACFMYFMGHQRSRGWKFCNLLAVLLFSVWDVEIMCLYLLIGYITELGITKEPSAATRTRAYNSLSVIQIPGHYNILPSDLVIVQITGGGRGGASETILTWRWLVAWVKREESASLYIRSIRDVICWSCSVIGIRR
jgi:hypothetical protein